MGARRLPTVKAWRMAGSLPTLQLSVHRSRSLGGSGAVLYCLMSSSLLVRPVHSITQRIHSDLTAMYNSFCLCATKANRRTLSLSPAMNLLRGFVRTLTIFCFLALASANGSAGSGPHLQERFRVGKLPNVTWAIGRQYAGNLPVQRGTNLSLFFWGAESSRGSLTAPAGKNKTPWNIWLNG